MKKIGITGPTGAGKSMLSSYLREQGVPVIDADALYHSLLVPPSDCLDALRRAFGDMVFFENGELNRQELGKIVFSDKEKLALLNETVLGFVLDEARSIFDRYEKEGVTLAGVDAPTLIESGFHRECDIVVSVLAEPSLRVERIMARDNIDRNAAQMRVDAQRPDAFYAESSQVLIENNTNSEEFLKRCGALLDAIKSGGSL